MPGPFDAPPEPTPVSTPEGYDPFHDARSDAWQKAQRNAEKSDQGFWHQLTKPESLAGEALSLGGLAGAILLITPIGRKLALGAMAVGLIVTGLSTLAEHKHQ